METFIEVEFKDGTVHQVAPEVLESLLIRNEIVRFKRADGWAIVGQSLLRDVNKRAVYSIPERRHS